MSWVLVSSLVIASLLLIFAGLTLYIIFHLRRLREQVGPLQTREQSVSEDRETEKEALETRRRLETSPSITNNNNRTSVSARESVEDSVDVRLRPILFVSTKSLRRACVRFYDDVNFCNYASAWNPLLAASKSLDLKARSELQSAMSLVRAENVEEETESFERLLNSVRVAKDRGLDGDSIVDQAAREAFLGAFKTLLHRKSEALEILESVTSKAIARFATEFARVATSSSEDTFHVTWFLQGLSASKARQEKNARRRLETVFKRVQEAQTSQSNGGDKGGGASVTVMQPDLIEVLRKSRRLGIAEGDQFLEKLLWRLERLILKASFEAGGDSRTDGMWISARKWLTLRGTLHNIQLFKRGTGTGDRGDEDQDDDSFVDRVLAFLPELRTREEKLTERLSDALDAAATCGGDRRKVEDLRATLKTCRSFGVEGSAPAAATTLASTKLLQVIVRDLRSEIVLKNFFASLELIGSDSLRRFVDHANRWTSHEYEAKLLDRWQHMQPGRAAASLRQAAEAARDVTDARRLKEAITGCRRAGVSSVSTALGDSEVELVKRTLEKLDEENRKSGQEFNESEKKGDFVVEILGEAAIVDDKLHPFGNPLNGDRLQIQRQSLSTAVSLSAPTFCVAIVGKEELETATALPTLSIPSVDFVDAVSSSSKRSEPSPRWCRTAPRLAETVTPLPLFYPGLIFQRRHDSCGGTSLASQSHRCLLRRASRCRRTRREETAAELYAESRRAVKREASEEGEDEAEDASFFLVSGEGETKVEPAVTAEESWMAQEGQTLGEDADEFVSALKIALTSAESQVKSQSIAAGCPPTIDSFGASFPDENLLEAPEGVDGMTSVTQSELEVSEADATLEPDVDGQCEQVEASLTTNESETQAFMAKLMRAFASSDDVASATKGKDFVENI